MASPRPSAAEFATQGANPTTHNGETTWWFQEPSAAVSEWLDRRGVEPDRMLHQMRADLPVEGPLPATTWAFRPGADDRALLDVNNRAFEWHPDQGAWTLDDLHGRMSEGWFDPDDCRIFDVEGSGGVDGFCWMKIHGADELGEIHVIALDPAHHGRGLGAALAVAGLEWVRRHRGVRTGMLYVESDNDVALALYRSLGFAIHHTDLGVVGPTPL